MTVAQAAGPTQNSGETPKLDQSPPSSLAQPPCPRPPIDAGQGWLWTAEFDQQTLPPPEPGQKPAPQASLNLSSVSLLPGAGGSGVWGLPLAQVSLGGLPPLSL